jgi:two-component system, sensor histidine kinase
MNQAPASGKSWRLRDQVGSWLVAACAVPLLLMAWLYSSLENRNLVAAHQSRLEAAAQTAAAAMDQYVKMHLAAVEYLAGNMSRGRSNPEAMTLELAAMRDRFPGFTTLLRTDENGTIRAVASGRSLADELAYAALGRSVADRPYFQIARDRGAGFISDAFRGRGLGSDVIFAVSAPVQADAQFAGVVQGALRIAAFDQMIERLALAADDLSLDVLDRSQVVLYSTGQSPRPLLSDPPDAGDSGGSGVANQNTGHTRYSASAPIGNLGWEVIVRSPGSAIAASRAQMQVMILAVAIVGIILIWLAIGRVAVLIAFPLELIRRDINRLDLQEGGEQPSLERLPARSSIEVHAIREGLRNLITRLDDARRGWMEAIAARDLSHAQLTEVLADREHYIAQQTDELKRALAAARAAGVAKDQLLANTSHEIRTPLNGIIGIAELLLKEDLGSRQHGRVETLLRSAEGLLALLNDLLDLARTRQDGLSLENVPFSAIAETETVMDSLRPLADRAGLELRLLVDAAVPRRVTGDALRLRQVLLNLVGNAIKFTERGSVTVELSAPAPGTIQFRVSDTGIGISDVDLARIFDPFVQVDGAASRRFQGSGLGLSIAQNLVQAMGGQLRVLSSGAGGSCFGFSLTLPEAPDAQAVDTCESIAAAVSPLPNAGRSLRVLVVDDVEVNREVALAQLESLDAIAVSVPGGPEALTALAQDDYDLILLDCQMPGMDGYATARAIRELKDIRQPTIVAMTANAQPNERGQCLAAGMDDYLAKPVRLVQLQELLNRLSVRPG